jgi:hypothetical protein
MIVINRFFAAILLGLVLGIFLSCWYLFIIIIAVSSKIWEGIYFCWKKFEYWI